MKKYILFLMIFLASFIVLFPGINGNAAPGQGDEPMHIATVRESVYKNQILIPNLNGAPNYFKPPLLFWMAIGMEKLFGQEIWVDRLPAVLMGALSVAIFFLLLQAAKVKNTYTWVASLVYLFSLSTFKFSRLLMMEQGLTLTFLLSAYYFILYLKDNRISWLVLAGISAGIGSLFKGPFFLAYTGFLLLVWANSIFLRFRQNPFVWKGKSSLKKIFTTFGIFHLGAMFPILLWLVTYYAYHGSDILKYFFVIENIGKFYFENQTELGIFLGWFLYTIPWTILIGYLVYYSNKQPVFLFRHKIGKYLLYTAMLITILHLLPNRKDAYYIVPSIPILLAGITLLLPNKLPQKFLYPLKMNVVFNTFLLTLFLFPIAIFNGYDYVFSLTLGIIFFSLGIIFFWKKYLGGVEKAILLTVIHGITFLDFFQLAVLPTLDYPLVPSQIKQKIHSKICIVSDEPWDAYSFAAYLSQKEVSHTFPEMINKCPKDHALIYFRTNPDVSVLQWKTWKKNLDFSEIIKNPTKIELYFDAITYKRSLKDDNYTTKQENN